jgi:hypothetical protein
MGSQPRVSKYQSWYSQKVFEKCERYPRMESPAEVATL